jgi:structural maintenance of chromosome 1
MLWSQNLPTHSVCGGCHKRFEARYRPAVEFAVGNAVVCTTEQECKRLCYTTNQAKKAVSLGGTVIRSAGPMEGGLSGLQRKASRWAEADMSKLKVERDQALKRINELSRTKRKKQELEALSSQIQG